MGYKARTSSGKPLKSVLAVLITLAAAFILSSCASEASSEFFAMDTVISVSVFGKNSEEALTATEKEIMRLDRLFSVGDAESDISKLNDSGNASVSDETAELISRSLDFFDKTDGLFDITVYPIVNAWGFFSENRVPGQSEIDSLLELVGSENVTVSGDEVSFSKDGVCLDLGAVAKGYASEKAAEIIREYGCKYAIISLGGNVYAVGTHPSGTPWNVAIRDPFDADSYSGYLQLTDCAAVTSGAYQRFFTEDGVTYHHIIDPRIGYPSDSGLASVTVVSGDATLADAYSTAVFIMGYEKAAEFWKNSEEDFELVLISDDGCVYVTEGLEKTFSSDKPFEVIYR